MNEPYAMLDPAKLDLGFQTVESLIPEATILNLSHRRFGLSRGRMMKAYGFRGRSSGKGQ